jgi:hypothetical protein
MQDNVITLAVDELNTGSTTNHVFDRFEEFSNRAVYIGENHALTAKDTLSLYRTFPKASGNFPGVAKSSFKFSKDYAITGVDGVASLTSPVIVEVSFSVPVGVAEADQLIMRQRAIALLDDDTIMGALMNQLMV